MSWFLWLEVDLTLQTRAASRRKPLERSGLLPGVSGGSSSGTNEQGWLGGVLYLYFCPGIRLVCCPGKLLVDTLVCFLWRVACRWTYDC